MSKLSKILSVIIMILCVITAIDILIFDIDIFELRYVIPLLFLILGSLFYANLL